MVLRLLNCFHRITFDQAVFINQVESTVNDHLAPSRSRHLCIDPFVIYSALVGFPHDKQAGATIKQYVVD